MDKRSYMNWESTNQEALMAMMIWEHALEDSGVRLWLEDGEGAYQARDNALLIAPYLVKAIEPVYAAGYDEAEDWEMVPKILPIIMRKADYPKDVSDEKAAEAAKEVHDLWKDDQQTERFGPELDSEELEDQARQFAKFTPPEDDDNA